MSRIVPSIAPARQSTSVANSSTELATSVATPAHEDLRLAVIESGWTLDALERQMGRPFYKSGISRVLNGERPLTQKFIDALPDDIEALSEKRRAQARGFLVIEQVDEQTAHEYLATGLFCLLTSRRQLPERAGAPLKADLKTDLVGRKAVR